MQMKFFILAVTLSLVGSLNASVCCGQTRPLPPSGNTASNPNGRVLVPKENTSWVLADLKKLKMKPEDLTDEKIEKLKQQLGPGSGGGGGSCGLVLIEHTKELLKYLQTDPYLKVDSAVKDAVVNAIGRSQFVLGRDLVLNGLKVDFINYIDIDNQSEFQPDTILVDQEFCSQTKGLSAKVVATLFHEYLRLAKIEDSAPQFPVSGPFFRRISRVMMEDPLVYAKQFMICKSISPASSLKITVFLSVYNSPSPSNPSGPAILGIDRHDSGSMTLLQVNFGLNEKTAQGEYVSFSMEGYKASKLVVKPNPSNPRSPVLSALWYEQDGENPLQMRCEILIAPAP